MKKILAYWNNYPFYFILILAIAFRIIATTFAQGYGFHDDHFLVLESAQSWVDGTDYNDWLPWSQLEQNPTETPKPQGHSFLYVGAHYVTLWVLDALGFDNPKGKMYFIRLLHALLSLIVVAFGYKITERISNQNIAKKVGLLLALIWFMPFFSVRNMVEITCIPFLFLSIWYLYKSEKSKKIFYFAFIAGVFLGIAFSIRYQTSFFILGIGIVLLIQKRWKELLGAMIGGLLIVLITQGLIDYYIWKQPFAEFLEYIRYNIEHRYVYGSNNLSMYFLVTLGLLLPPMCFFWLFGFFRTWKKHLIIFLPTLLFFVFHTYFPNKQERFILPVVPFFLLLGVIGWEDFLDKSKFWIQHTSFYKGLVISFWVLNIILLSVFSITYTKKSRVEAMVYLYHQNDVKAVLTEDTNRSSISTLPSYYMGDWKFVYKLPMPKSGKNINNANFDRNSHYVRIINSLEYFELNPDEIKPNYFLFFDDKNLSERINNVKKYYPNIEFQKIIKPSFIDIIMRKLNPTNANQLVYIYKIDENE